MRHCRQRMENGALCRANAGEASGFCFFHDPKRAAERLEAQKTGGRRNKGVSLPPSAPDCVLERPSDVVAILASTINSVRRGQLDPKLANSVGFLSGILLRALEMNGLERRISDLEAAIKSQAQFSALDDTSEFEFIQEVGHEQETDQED